MSSVAAPAITVMPLPRSAGISFRGFGSIPMKGSCRNGPAWRSSRKPLLVILRVAPTQENFPVRRRGASLFRCWCRLASVDITTLPALVNLPGTEATDLKRAVLLQQGKTLSEQNKLTDSFAALTQLAKLSPKDSAVSSLLGNVRGRLVQQHYNQGIRLYREKN